MSPLKITQKGIHKYDARDHTLPDDARQALQRAHVGNDGYVDLFHGEAGAGAAVTDVARCDEVHPSTDTGACTGQSVASSATVHWSGH